MILLGVDWGERRIGLAVSWSGELASPLSVVAAQPSAEASAETIAKAAVDVEPDLIVLGVPAGNRHDADQIRQKFETIATALRQKICKPVVLWDESYSTTEARALRDASPRRRRRSQPPIDSAAAAVILQSYIDEQLRKGSTHE